ncbi:hypothetical protein MHU86_611 [Fragilaria crotonensis]|nr:hypothetical protein MHU86_611 [Fragilaria crotonensis]
MGVDWQLSTCCGNEEVVFCCLFAGYFLVNLVLWKTPLLKPMKLIAVFIHEMGHATACWWTGGKVEKIEVYNNEGGVTKYRGGIRAIIIPAGYVGGAFWGGVFVTLSGDRVAATVAASIFVIAMLISLRFSPNGMLVGLTLGFSLFTLLFIFLDWFVFDPLLQYVTLYYGVFIGSFSVYDIYDDLITRTVEGSDAHACHKLIPCCFPRCVGVQFAVLALFFQGLGVYLALVWMTST